MHDMDNGKNGHCWIYVVMQAFAVDGGWPVTLTESALSHLGGDRRYNLCRAARLLAASVVNVTQDPMIIGGLTGPQVAFDKEEIQRLALNYRAKINNPVDLRNTMLYMDPVRGGGGHGGMEAIRALAEGVGIDLPMGPEVEVLTAYCNGSTAKRVALIDEDAGHWSLQVFMVS